MAATATHDASWLRIAPALFVLLWSTGFVGAKYGLPYAPPWTFLAIRLVIVAVLLALWAVLRREPWPRSWVFRPGSGLWVARTDRIASRSTSPVTA